MPLGRTGVGHGRPRPLVLGLCRGSTRSSRELWGRGSGSGRCRCRQHPLALPPWAAGLGDQGRGKGIFFQEELEVGVLGKGLF